MWHKRQDASKKPGTEKGGEKKGRTDFYASGSSHSSTHSPTAVPLAPQAGSKVGKAPFVSTMKHDTPKNHKIKPIRAQWSFQSKKKKLGPKDERLSRLHGKLKAEISI